MAQQADDQKSLGAKETSVFSPANASSAVQIAKIAVRRSNNESGGGINESKRGLGNP